MKLRVTAICAGLGALLVTAVPGYAADEKVTYYEHVAPIMQANCMVCHKPAGKNIGSLVAPMSLMTYEETRPWARAIARRVKAKEMPPWFADHPKGVFSNERGLTDQQIQTILSWVESGAPAGDQSKAPASVQFTEAESGGYSLGKPDFIVKMEKPYFLDDDAQDVHGNFRVKISEDILPNDVVVRGWEFRAGTYLAGQDTVHHMCAGVRPTGSREEGGDEAESEGNLSLGCIAGGAEPNMLPDGFGMKIQKGSTVNYGMHYYKQPGPGTGFWNQAEIGFYLAKGPIRYNVSSTAIAQSQFEIPPHAVNYKIGAARMLTKDTLYLALWPHAHLRATAARYTATYPDGRKEVLLDVPRYDQTWQVTYKYKQPKLLPKGTIVDVEMLYDNSADRGAKRLFNPNLVINQGPRTQDEMMMGFISLVELEPGQEPPANAQQQQD